MTYSSETALRVFIFFVARSTFAGAAEIGSAIPASMKRLASASLQSISSPALWLKSIRPFLLANELS